MKDHNRGAGREHPEENGGETQRTHRLEGKRITSKKRMAGQKVDVSPCRKEKKKDLRGRGKNWKPEE